MGYTGSFGKNGEDEAASFLQKKGYKIIARNFRARGGEIDLIALKSTTLIFIEVKSRTSTLFGTPAESITYHKLAKLIRTAELFRKFHPGLPADIRFDAIEVYTKSGIQEINHIENITL